jgi:hypothetical protein
MTTDRPPSGGVEDRLRAALAARAGQITAADLAPSVPPTAALARRWRLRLLWRPLLAGAGVLAVIVVVLVVGPLRVAPPGRGPVAPAATVPSESPMPTMPAEPEPEPVPAGSGGSTPPMIDAVPGRSR